MDKYMPEGLVRKEELKYTISKIRQALETGEILEGKVVKADSEMNCTLQLGNYITGILPKEEFEYREDGKELRTAAVISKVNKTVQFKVVGIEKEGGNYTVRLSRKQAQKECYDNFISKLEIGQIIDAKATFVESYGIFCDIGCGITALMPIENLCTVKIINPKTWLKNIGKIKAIIKYIDGNHITLSHKELLGTWEENASKFDVGDTVNGIVRNVEDYGVFVELAPNLVGLADKREDVNIGDSVSVYVRELNPEKMKVKLMIVANDGPIDCRDKVKYNYNIPKTNTVKDWVYSPECSAKKVETHFN